MEDFESIEEKIKNLKNEQISKVKSNLLPSLILLIIGIITIFLGAKIVPNETLKLLIVVLGFIIAAVGIVYLLKNTGKNSGYYVYEPTKQRLKKYQIYLEAADAKKILSYINSNNFNGLKDLKKVANSGKLLDVRGTDDASIFLFQLSEYIPHNFVLASPVVVLQGSDAKLMLEFVKS